MTSREEPGGRSVASVSEPVRSPWRWGLRWGVSDVGGKAVARCRELSFVGLRRASSPPRDVGFALIAAKPRKFSALRLPLTERRRAREGSADGGAGALGSFGVSD